MFISDRASNKTNGRFGKFRPFMVIGSVIMAVSVVLLYVLTPFVPASMMWLRYTLFILLYAVWVIGYTFQTSVTRAAQAVLTNDPTAPAVHDLQHGRLPRGYGHHAVHRPHPRARQHLR